MCIPKAAPGVALAGSFGVDELLSLPTSSWDKRIATDLIAEMEIHLSDKVATLPEMRRILAVKGYVGLQRRIESEIKGMSGAAAVRAMADAMRNYALDHPGLSAATFRTSTTDSPEWRQALFDVSQVVLRVFAEVGLDGEPAQHALRMLRSLIRGFVLNEMAASFLDPLDYEASFKLAIDAFVMGMPAFTSSIDQSVTELR
jgi:Tetracyclin repressor-like, C-terminal domain